MGKKQPFTEEEAADVEHLALVFARSMGGWNEDTSEQTIDDPALRVAAEAHWARVNDACLRAGRKLARLAVHAGYLNRPDFRSVLQVRMEHDEQEVFAGDA